MFDLRPSHPAHRGGARRAVIVALVALVALGVAAPPATSHLSIIRQGPESRNSAEAGDIFGSSVTAGDFNGDGIDDLAIGSPGEDVATVVNGGVITVNWGSDFGLTHVGAQTFSANDFGGATAGEEFGYALAAGDFNDDGYDDLAVGCPGYVITGVGTHVGRVCLLRGTPSGLVVWHELYQSTLGGSNDSGDRFGEVLCAGNLDGETGSTVYEDLVISAPGEDNAVGAVFWVRGTGGGLFGLHGIFMATDLGWTTSPDDRFGASLAIGNLVGDDIPDLVVGHPFEDYFTLVDVGRVHVIPGASGGPTATGATSVLAGDTGGTTPGGWFGLSVAVGRFGNEPGNYMSLAVGEPRYDSTTADQTGRVHVFHGGATELSSTGALHELAVGGGAVFPDDRFGWRVATGKFDDDLWDDLVIGCPYERWTGAEFQTGKVFISFGGSEGVGNHGWANFNQATLNDRIEGSELLGASLAIGDFDSSNRGAIAVGAPGEDAFAGQVHIIAPWRQVYDLSCRHSVVTDCDGNLVFSQKAFDPVWIASTTKIMTVLVACEAVQAGEVAIDALYDIPDWVVADIPGSQVPLITGERMSLRNLLITCLALSGNDAAHAIANIVEGEDGPLISLPAFVTRMNTRAAQLGMTGTSFHNPAGLDQVPIGPVLGPHRSTPMDMVLLGQAAMANELFDEVVSTTRLTIERQGEVFGAPWSMQWSCNSFFTWIIDNLDYVQGTGIKGGWTPNARTTGVFSGTDFAGGDAVAGTFSTPRNLPGFPYGNDAVAVLNLGLDVCGASTPYEPVPDQIHLDRTRLSTYLDDLTGGSAQIGAQDDDPVAIDFVRSSGLGSTAARLAITHLSEALLQGPPTTFEIVPFEAHEGYTLFNLGSEAAAIEVTPSYGGSYGVEIAAGARYEIPPYTGPDPEGVRMSFDALGTATVHVAVESRYVFEHTFDAGSGVQFTAELERPGTGEDTIDLVVTGLDPNPGSTLAAFVRNPDVVVGVPSDGSPAVTGDGGPVRVRSAAPNPFRAGTRITFALARAGEVEVRVHDVAGRAVRRFDAMTLDDGSWSVHWNGADDRGLPVADGIYFYEIRLDGRAAATGKLVRRR